MKLYIQMFTNNKEYSIEIFQGMNRNSMALVEFTLEALRKTSKKWAVIILKYKEANGVAVQKRHIIYVLRY